jgi:hypothetical protein
MGITSCTTEAPEELHQQRYLPDKSSWENWPPPPRPAHPWETGMFQDGIHVYWHYKASDEFMRDKMNAILDYVVLRQSNAIGISFPIYTDGATPTKVYAGKDTPTPEEVAMMIELAKERNLRVFIRPLINELNIVDEDPAAWRGNIFLADPDAWFKSYIHLIKPYATAAAENGADEFVAGAELLSLQSLPGEWKRVIAAIQATGFAGEISYATNWVGDKNSTFHDTAVDAYPSVPLGDGASVRQLSKAIVSWLHSRYSTKELQRLTIQEAGIPALSGMYQHPWWWGGNDQKLNLDIQVKWFSAMCAAAHEAGVEGIYYWNLDTDIDFRNPDFDVMSGYSGSFYGRPGAESIKQCYLETT